MTKTALALAAVLEAIKPYTQDDETSRPWLKEAKAALRADREYTLLTSVEVNTLLHALRYFQERELGERGNCSTQPYGECEHFEESGEILDSGKIDLLAEKLNLDAVAILADENTATITRATSALAIYPSSTDASDRITNLLTDLRHYAEGNGLDFEQCASLSYSLYAEEDGKAEGSPRKLTAIATVSGGVAEVAEKPAGVELEIIDFDNLREALVNGVGSERILLSPASAAFIQRTDPVFWSQIEARTDIQ